MSSKYLITFEFWVEDEFDSNQTAARMHHIEMLAERIRQDITQSLNVAGRSADAVLTGYQDITHAKQMPPYCADETVADIYDICRTAGELAQAVKN